MSYAEDLRWLWQRGKFPGQHVVSHYSTASDLPLADLLAISWGYLLLCCYFSVLSSFAIGWEEYLTGVSTQGISAVLLRGGQIYSIHDRRLLQGSLMILHTLCS